MALDLGRGNFAGRDECTDATFRKARTDGSHTGANLGTVGTVGAAVSVVVAGTSNLNSQAHGEGVARQQ